MALSKTDIINAAFRTWGQTFYQRTSLSDLARNLGITKAALYRHFEHKQALLDAMYEYFFDRYAAFIKPGYTKARETEDVIESQFILMRTIVEYYARNADAFLFALFMVYHKTESEQQVVELSRRGIDLGNIRHLEEYTQTYPSMLRLIVATLIFWVASFHRNADFRNVPPSDEEVGVLIRWLEEKIAGGLGLRREVVEHLNFEGLDRAVPRNFLDALEDAGLLKAVAEAVAEAGPWNASMDMVARRSGLSKSGLYAHFKNKQDMIKQLFLTEFERILAYAEAAIGESAVPEEQFYLAIAAIVDYFRSRPEILTALDWIKTRRLDWEHPVLPRMGRIFSDIMGEGCPVTEGLSGSLKEQTSHWILFLTANILMRLPPGMAISEFPNKSQRILYKFIALGVDGCKSCYK
ncbi:MAG: TetR/AcrR family transcriptional regulator [Spirochaetaceae bacterium]|jgi:AcrR family transcriptional regulator|nr:TetR/AcrR family transcriptional regulator [Spirochaetaceae bacterium]